MKVEIKEQKENPLLGRKEIFATAEFDDTTPSNADMAKKLADLTKSDVELVKMNKIDCIFGTKNAEVHAFIYDSKEAMAEAERKSRKQRKAEKEEAKKAKEEAAKAKEEAAATETPAEKPEEKADEKPAEKPSEEPKEEKKEEKKEESKEEKSE